MNTVNTLVQSLHATLAEHADAVLATVVKVEDSAYRRPGARMLVCADGQHSGTVSGGCLEGEIVRKAWWLTSGGAPVVCRYDTGAGEDAEWTFGLGCNGAVHILLEHIRKDSPQLQWLERIAQQRRPGACAVVIGRSGVGNVDVGQRVFIDPDGSAHGELAEPSLTQAIRRDLTEALKNGGSALHRYPVGNGDVEVFLEVLKPPTDLVIFGAGHDAVPLAQMAKSLGWRVTIADGRAHFARRDRYPMADQVCVLDLADALPATGIGHDSVAVVMTHSYEQDQRILAQLLEFKPRYIGQLGPRSRTERMLGEIGAREKAAALQQAGILHYPIGLDLGADAPEEVALAILAEIKATTSGHPAGKLSQRGGSIHQAPAAGENS